MNNINETYKNFDFYANELCKRFDLCDEDIKDIIQEAFLYLIKCLNNPKGFYIKNYGGFVMWKCINLCKNFKRDKIVERKFIHDFNINNNYENQFEIKEPIYIKIYNGLKKKEMNVLMMKRFGISFSEMTIIMGGGRKNTFRDRFKRVKNMFPE